MTLIKCKAVKDEHFYYYSVTSFLFFLGRYTKMGSFCIIYEAYNFRVK
jgi:hypothetical protein